MRGRAIGLIFMGISGSLVFGVRAGIAISGMIDWRGVFVALALLAAIVLSVTWHNVPASGRRETALSRYLRHLGETPLIAGQFVSILMIGGRLVLFAFLAPYLVQVADIADKRCRSGLRSVGSCGVSGGHLGGWLADGLSPRVALLTPAIYLGALAAIPLLESPSWLMFGAMMVWACIRWMISPVVQSVLIATGPDTAEAGISLNFSAMHVGVGLGTAIGGLSLEKLSILALPWVGTILAALAVAASSVALWYSGGRQHRRQAADGEAPAGAPFKSLRSRALPP